MKKSVEQLQAEQIVASLLATQSKESVLLKARNYANNYKYAIAEQTTITIMLCTLWDMWEDFDASMMKQVYEQYRKYDESFNAGNENILQQMNTIDEMLDGKLLKTKLFDAIRRDE